MSLLRLIQIALLLAITAQAQPGASPAAAAKSAEASPQKSDSAPADIQVECLPASRASELLGKHGCVAGRVSRITILKNGSTHISLCPPRSHCSFRAVVSKRDHDNVGELYYLHGKLVAIVGDVVRNRGRLDIVVKERQQIRVTAGNSPPEFDAAQAKPRATQGGKHRLR